MSIHRAEPTDGVGAARPCADPEVPLDRGAGSPLYAQIRDGLRQQIVDRTLLPGEPLPTEEALQERYGVSRSVVRQALGDLADQGLVLRHRGRGSVVAPLPEHHRRANQAGGLRQQLEARGHQVQTEIVELTVDEAPSPAAAALGCSETWVLERVRLVDGNRMLYMRTWLSRELFPHLTAESLGGGSLHDWMRAHGVEPIGGPRQLQAVPADDAVAAHLELAVGAPVLLMQGVTCDRDGRGLEWFRAWHRPDTVFDIDAEVGPRPPRAAGKDLGRARELLEELTSLLHEP